MKKTFFCLVLFLFVNFINGQQLKIYIANDDHDDLEWQASEATYMKTWVSMLDYYLNLADTHKNETDQFQSKFTADGTLWVWSYQQSKSATDFSRLMDRIRDGHINVLKTPTTLTFGGMTAEAVIRSMYYAGELERKYNVKFSMANGMENATMPFGLVSLLAGSGCKYSWKGVCNCGSGVAGLTNAARVNDIYWWKGLDDQKMIMKWYSLTDHGPIHGGDQSRTIGGYAEGWDVVDAVDYVSSNATFKARVPYNIIGVFGRGWDTLATKTDEFITIAKSSSNANRKVIVSNEIDFFQDFEATYGANLVNYNASFGNEWELEQAAMEEVSSNVKRNIEKMRTAEVLASYASLIKPDFMDQYNTTKRKAWLDLGTFYNHDWFPYFYVSNADFIKFYRDKAASFVNYVAKLHDDAAVVLSANIKKTGTNTRFFVLNALSWERTDFVDLPYTSADVHVVEVATKTEVPSQLVTVDNQKYLRILASKVPSVGYKVYEIISGKGTTYPAAAAVSNSGSNTILENDYYKITIAPRGAIISLIDKTRNNKEFAQSDGGIYLNDMGASTGTLSLVNNGPVSVTVLASAASPLSHKSWITLYKNVQRIDIKNEINQNFHGNYSWGFGFNMSNPQLWHEEIGAILKANLLANGGHYSPKFARYDWFSLNHFADINGSDNLGITVSSPDCQFFKYGNSTTTTLDAATPKISVMIGYNDTYGIVNQGGDSYFLQRFSLIPHDGYNQTNSMKMSLEHQNTFYAKEITGGQKLPESTYSLINISDPNVFLWSLKPAEDGFSGAGLVARVWNMNTANSNFNISSPTSQILSGKELTHVETPISDATISSGRISASANKNQMKTYSLVLKSDVLDAIEPSGSFNGYKTPEIRPNPAVDYFEVINLSGNGSITIYSSTGQIVKTIGYSGSSARVNSGNLEKGIYLVKILNGDKKEFTDKIVIK